MKCQGRGVLKGCWLNVLFFWFFWLEFGDVNLDKIVILCCLNCISECINGFSVLKNP
jgi:hypothetical protein